MRVLPEGSLSEDFPLQVPREGYRLNVTGIVYAIDNWKQQVTKKSFPDLDHGGDIAEASSANFTKWLLKCPRPTY